MLLRGVSFGPPFAMAQHIPAKIEEPSESVGQPGGCTNHGRRQRGNSGDGEQLQAESAKPAVSAPASISFNVERTNGSAASCRLLFRNKACSSRSSSLGL